MSLRYHRGHLLPRPVFMDHTSPHSQYQLAIAHKGFVSDAAQLRAVELLQRCHEALHQLGAIEESPRGIYLWGRWGVARPG